MRARSEASCDLPRSDPIRFRQSVWLTKSEAFQACQALADADRFLVRAGRRDEADALGDLFDLLEERLTAGPVATGPGSTRPQSSPGSNSSDREFTQ